MRNPSPAHHRLFRVLVLDGLLLLSAGCDTDEPADGDDESSSGTTELGDGSSTTQAGDGDGDAGDGDADTQTGDGDGDGEADSGDGDGDTGDGDTGDGDGDTSESGDGDGDTTGQGEACPAECIAAEHALSPEDDDWNLGCSPLSTICCWVSTEGQDPDCCGLCCPESP